MRFGEYLYAKAVTLCFLGIGTLFLDIFLAFAEVPFAFLFVLNAAVSPGGGNSKAGAAGRISVL